MRTIRLKKELPVIAIVLLPFIYLAFIWNTLPQKVPLHWNIQGQIDRFGDKYELILIPILLPLLIYLIFLIVPFIDPKNKIKNMGKKYYNIKILLTLFMSILALFIMFSVKNQSLSNPNIIVLIIGVLYIVLGNYFKTIRPNYFIGIRTPWTLENETVWKETHKFSGKIWLPGGILIICSSLLFDKKINFILFTIITILLVGISVLYSYIVYLKIKNKKD